MSQNYANNMQDHSQMVAALQWYVEQGVDELLLDEPVDRTVLPELSKIIPPTATKDAGTANVLGFQDKSIKVETPQGSVQGADGGNSMMGAAQAIIEAQKLANACQSLEELKKAIFEFHGLSIRNTATNMVFAEGHANSSIMLIGEAPGADEDISGKPFAGAVGQLLDKILSCVNLSRNEEDTKRSVYLSNILNWRPPGNRTPTQAEMEISLPFIERHMALVQPKAVILCGGTTAKSILRKSESISKLRGRFHEYQVQGTDKTIPMIVTYHPAYLLQTPAQKKAVWADMLMFQDKLKNILT